MGNVPSLESSWREDIRGYSLESLSGWRGSAERSRVFVIGYQRVWYPDRCRCLGLNTLLVRNRSQNAAFEHVWEPDVSFLFSPPALHIPL